MTVEPDEIKANLPTQIIYYSYTQNRSANEPNGQLLKSNNKDTSFLRTRIKSSEYKT